MSGCVYFRQISVRRAVQIAVAAAAASVLLIMVRRTLIDALVIIAGGATVAFLSEPIAEFYARRFPRNLSALCALLTWLAALLIFLWLLLPVIIAEVILLAEILPESVESVKVWLRNAVGWLQKYIPELELPSPSLNMEYLPMIAQNTIGFAGGIADFFYRFSLMVVLGYFFLCDRERILIRMELLVPRLIRTTAVKTGNAVCRELKLYLRGQGLVAAIVGTLAAAALALVGVRSALVLGIIIGILNMIPYFGPVIGAVPAVLMALSSGWTTAASAIIALWLVQQIDGTLISPRVMGSLSGLSPATVLLAIFIGSGLGGIVGMLLAMPVIMAYRTVFRIFVQRYENV